MAGLEDHRCPRWGGWGVEAAQSLGFLVGTAICLAFGVGLLVGWMDDSSELPAAYSGETINPNDAPVASLIRLPGLGPTRARAIVAHRTTIGRQLRQPAPFTQPEDLQQVRGIGPATILAIRPWLDFEPLPVQEVVTAEP